MRNAEARERNQVAIWTSRWMMAPQMKKVANSIQNTRAIEAYRQTRRAQQK